MDLLKSEPLTGLESNINPDESDEDVSADVSERQHDKLLDAIASLAGQKKSVQKQRNEPVVAASEFHTSAGDEKVNLNDLVGALQSSSSSHIDLKKQLNRVQKQQKVLSTPLPKQEQEKIERTVAYEKTCQELRKWDPVVQKNRKSEQLEFPLLQPDLRLITSDQFVKRFQPSTPLEKEIAALLHGSDNVLKPGAILTPAEEKALRAMSIEEAKERRAELQKHRALLSYKEKKARRQKKIKSKKYHRIMRKEKEKQEKRTLDELEKTDPEAYMEKLQNMERQRIQERMSLKHRGGSKTMKKQALYSKYDDNARQAIQEMIRKNKELTQKVIVSDDEDEVVSEVDEPEMKSGTSGIQKNPWMSATIKKKLVRITKPEEIKSDMKSSDNETNGTDNVVHNVSDMNVTVDNKKTNGDDSENSDSENSDAEVEKSRARLRAEEFQNIDDIFNEADKKKQKQKKLEKSKKKKLKENMKLKQEIEIAKKRERQQESRKQRESESSESESESDFSESENDQMKDEELAKEKPEGEELTTSLKRKNKLEDFEDNWSDDDAKESKETITYTPDLDAFTRNRKQSPSKKQKSVTKAEGTNNKEVRLDPSKFFTVDSSVKQSNSDSGLVVNEGDNQTKEDEQRMTIAQAFASDDVIEEFVVEKQTTEDRDKPKDIDLTLPGWGDWGGLGIQSSKKKRKKFIIKAPPTAPRRDKNLSNVIISETKDNSVVKHQVNQLPFPFTNVHDFQKSIRQPIGKTWNPETSYREMIRPKVTTKLGTIIDPIDKSEVFKNSNKRKSSGDLDFSDRQTEDNSKKSKRKTKKKGK